MREGWTYKKLGELAVFYRGLTYNKNDEVASSNVCVLRSNNIDLDSQTLVLDELKYLREDFEIPQDKKIKANSIFVCMSNGSKQHVGKVAFIDKDMDFAFGGFMGLVVPKDNVVAKYIYYICRSSIYRQFLLSIGNGIGITNLKFSDLRDFIVPVPTLQEQQQIVSELDLLSSVIEKQKDQIEELDKLAQSIFYDMFGDPVENEKGWEAKKLSKVYKLKSGDGLSAKQFIKGPYPVYGGNGISGYHNTYNMSGNYVIIGRVGVYCGNVRNVSGNFWLTDNAFQLVYDESKQTPVFITHLLTYLNLHQYANHAAQPVISNSTLKDVNILFPPLFLQREFTQKIEAIESMKAKVRQSLKESEMLFNSRMDYYFN